MKHRREIFTLLLVLVAVAILMLTPRTQTKPTAVAGVSVGMTAHEVEAVVGPADMKTELSWMYFDGSRMDPRIVVTFDQSGHVAAVSGKQPAVALR